MALLKAALLTLIATLAVKAAAGRGSDSNCGINPPAARLLQQVTAPAPANAVPLLQPAALAPATIASEMAVPVPAPEQGPTTNPFAPVSPTAPDPLAGLPPAAAPAPALEVLPPMALVAPVAAAAEPAAEELFASEFRLSGEQAAVLGSLYGNPPDPVASIQADLQQAGVMVEPTLPFPAPLPEDTLYDTVLLAQVKEGRVPAVEQLLGGAADPNVADAATGETPLFYAVAQRAQSPQLLPLLLSSGADTNVRDANGTTVLLLAISRADNETVVALLSAGADTNLASASGLPPLLAAVQRAQLSIVEDLLSAGADTNKAGPAGELPLVQAVLQYEALPSEAGLGMIEALLDYGASPNLADAQGTSAVNVAEQAQDMPLLDLLAQYGAAEAPAAELTVAVAPPTPEILAAVGAP